MNRSTFTFIVSVLLFFIVIFAGYLVSFKDEVQGVVEPQSIPSPTPAVSQVIGTIDEVGEQVSYKNAKLYRVNGQSIYVSKETRIVDPNNIDINPNLLVSRQAVIVEGTPAEGGIDATKIIIVTSSSPTIPANKSSTPSSTILPHGGS